MIKVSIRADNWAVSATEHDDNIPDNPFNGVNEDTTVAYALAAALEHAAHRLWNPLFVLALVVVYLDDSGNFPCREAANKFIAAATEYVDAAEKANQIS